jgi:hypothetical protein
MKEYRCFVFCGRVEKQIVKRQKLNSPWDNGNLVSIVGFLQKVVEITHDSLEGVTHEIQGAIRENDRIFLVGAKVFFGNDIVAEFTCTIRGKGSYSRRATSSPCSAEEQPSSSRRTHQHGVLSKRRRMSTK